MKKKDYDGPLYAPWHLVEKGKGDIFLDKDTHKLYVFDGNEWWEIVPTSELKKTD